jgi:hypothetical protein
MLYNDHKPNVTSRTMSQTQTHIFVHKILNTKFTKKFHIFNIYKLYKTDSKSTAKK